MSTLLLAAIAVKLSTSVGFAPLDVRVRVHVDQTVESDRVVSVTAESGAFRRSSSWTVDGAESRKTYWIEWRGLPPGEYDVTAMVASNTAIRATARATLLVQ